MVFNHVEMSCGVHGAEMRFGGKSIGISDGRTESREPKLEPRARKSWLVEPKPEPRGEN